jgi:hypothetical protein
MQLNNKQINEINKYFETKPVLKAYVFGSVVRDEANDTSDIDILVDLDYSKRIGLLFVQMKFDLENILKKPVDLVSSNGLSKYLKPIVDKEKKIIYVSKS